MRSVDAIFQHQGAISAIFQHAGSAEASFQHVGNLTCAFEGVAGPVAPSGLTATVVSSSQIDLDWVDNASDEDTYEVQRSTDQITWTVLTTTLPANTIDYSSTGLSGSTLYYYRVRGIKNGYQGDWSNVASATTSASVIVYDPFTDTGLTSLTAHNPSIFPSTTWITFGGGTLRIAASGIAAESSDPALTGALRSNVIESAVSDGTVECWFSTTTLTFAFNFAALNYRYVNAANRMRVLIQFTTTDAGFALQSIIGGSAVTRATGLFGSAPVAGTFYNIEVVLVGSSHIVNFGLPGSEIQVISYTDPGGFPTGTQHGLSTTAQGVCLADEFYVRP